MLFNRFVMAIWRWWELLPRRLRPADPPARVQQAFDERGAAVLRAELLPAGGHRTMNTTHKHRRFDWLYRRGLLGIPLGLWLLFAVAVTAALAAWLYLVVTASVSVTSQAFGPFTVTSASTQQGTCLTVFTPPDLVAVTWANAAPGGTPCAVRAVVSSPAGSATGFGKWSAVTASPAVILEDLSCAGTVAGGASKNYEFRITLDPATSAPGQNYSPVYKLEIAPAAQTCP